MKILQNPCSKRVLIISLAIFSLLGSAFFFFADFFKKFSFVEIPSPTQVSSEHVERKASEPTQSATFQEAANKRFHITKSDVLSQIDGKEATDVKDTLNREMLLAKLTTEVLDHRPDLVESARVQVMARNPKILHLSQIIDGEIFEQKFVVSDTLKCDQIYRQSSENKIVLTQLFSDYCVDRNFDYPGGFRDDVAINLKSYSMDHLADFEGVEIEFDKLHRVALRGLIIEDFTQHYKTTGKLSYVN